MSPRRSTELNHSGIRITETKIVVIDANVVRSGIPVEVHGAEEARIVDNQGATFPRFHWRRELMLPLLIGIITVIVGGAVLYYFRLTGVHK